jgi:hypothetical protein
VKLRKTHPAGLSDEQLLVACDERYARAGGPGGQHKDRSETAVTLRHKPTEVTARASERRSQAENRRRALFRLRLALAVEIRSANGDEGPSERWRARCLNGRIAVAEDHPEWPALLAEALDALAEAGWAPAAAGRRLGVSGSQLVKLVGKHPPALEYVNAARRERGAHPLKPR